MLTVTFSRFSRWDILNLRVAAITQKWKHREVYLVNTKQRPAFTHDLSTCIGHSPPLLPLCSPDVFDKSLQLSSTQAVINTPICFSVNCMPLSCGLFHFPLRSSADEVITINPPADRRMLCINKQQFQRANWLISILFFSFSPRLA